MKNNIFKLFTITFLFYTPFLFPQNLEVKLNDPDIFVRREALWTITNGNLKSYIPAIEKSMFKQSEPFMIYNYLKALHTLDADSISKYCYKFIALADSFENMRPIEDPLEMKVRATFFLFDEEDYSTVQYVIDILKRDRPDVNADAILLLGRMTKELPEYYDYARNELLFIAENSKDETSRFNATLYLRYSMDEQ